MELDPAELDASARYRALVGAITPRPIAWVSTISPSGVVNVAPFSFFNGFSAEPMIVGFSPMTKDDGSDKDTLRNALLPEAGGTGEFVVHVVDEASIRAAAATAANLGPTESEVDFAHLETTPSRRVKPPRIVGAPVAFECRTHRVIRFAEGVPMSGNLVLGEVVHVFVRDDLVNERLHVDPARLRSVGRLGGRAYSRTRERFELGRGRDALDATLPFEPE